MTKKHTRLKLWFDRMLSRSLLEQFLILGGVLLVLFLLSWFFLHLSGCHWEDFTKDSNIPEWLLPLYLLIDSNAFNCLYINGVHGWALVISSITFVLGAFIFNGAIIAIITNAIEQRVQNHQGGRIHYLKSGHFIIMGYDDMVPSIITHIFNKDPEAFVLLMSSVAAEQIREQLRKVFSEKQLKRIIINYGHRMSKDYYDELHLEAAEEIFIVGKRSLPAHDAVNVECVDSICAYLEHQNSPMKPKRITCVFEDLDTYAAFKTTEIFGRVKLLDIEFVPYNFFTGWAKQVFVKQYHRDLDRPNEKIPYPAVYGDGIRPDDTRFVHLVFVGTTNFSVAFAMEAAHVLHFANFNEQNGYPKTLITFIDINADKEKDEFITRYRHFFEVQSHYYQDLSENALTDVRRLVPPTYFNEGNGYGPDDRDFLDVEFEFIKGDVFSANVQAEICRWAREHRQKQYLSIFLAQHDQRRNFAFGMNMPDEVYDHEVPVFIRQDRSDNFVSNLRDADEAIRTNSKKNTYSVVENGGLKQTVAGGRYANIFPFGMNETAFCADDISLERAKLVNYLYETAHYEKNAFQSRKELDDLTAEQIRTDADTFWRKLSVALKWSNLYNAYNIGTKLATLRAMRGLAPNDTSQDTQPLTEHEVDILARTEHNRWNVEKLLMGYRKPHRDEDKYLEVNKPFKNELKQNKNRFIHHDLRPYEQLEGVEKLDMEFSRYLPWLLEMTRGKTE